MGDEANITAGKEKAGLKLNGIRLRVNQQADYDVDVDGNGTLSGNISLLRQGF
jgi:hypothetical protein